MNSAMVTEMSAPKKRLTKDQKQKVVDRYISGETGTAIAGDLGLSVQAIYALLRRRNVHVRSSAEAWVPRSLPILHCEECGTEIPNRKDRQTSLCLACTRKRRCATCGQLLGVDESKHTCNGIDLRGERYCTICSKELKSTGYERWHPICITCQWKQNKARERDARAELRQAYGGKCQRCGYDRCQEALHFHHLDSSEKRKFRSSGGTSVRELRQHPERFELLCANCHTEVHSLERLQNDPKE